MAIAAESGVHTTRWGILGIVRSNNLFPTYESDILYKSYWLDGLGYESIEELIQ